MDKNKQLSSCNPYFCNNNVYNMQKQAPRSSNFSPYFECNDRLKFKQQNEPMNKSGYVYINPDAVSNIYASDFEQIQPEKSPFELDYPGKVYASNDPRLISNQHNGQVMFLDTPPIDTSIKLAEIYTNPRMKEYGKRYNDYSDINVGQITYYIDRSIEDSLFQPLFENPANVEGKIYKDPMGATYPEYERIPIKNNSVLQTKNRTYTNGLSWIDDSNETREDILHLQMRPQDRRRYATRWTGNLSY